jgi:hypothetical protein
MNSVSHSPIQWQTHHILGDPGTQRWRWVFMAVQVFLRLGLGNP